MKFYVNVMFKLNATLIDVIFDDYDGAMAFAHACERSPQFMALGVRNDTDIECYGSAKTPEGKLIITRQEIES